MKEFLRGAGENWVEGWRVIGRYLLFKIELWISLLSLVILIPLVDHFVLKPAEAYDVRHGEANFPALLLAFALLGVFIYIPLAFHFTAQASGLMRRRDKPMWKEDLDLPGDDSQPPPPTSFLAPNRR